MLVLKIPPANAGDIRDVGSILGEGHGSPLQYSCLKNPMDGGTWRATVYGVAKSGTRLSDTHTLVSGEMAFEQESGLLPRPRSLK